MKKKFINLREECPEQFWGTLCHTLLEESVRLLCDKDYLSFVDDAHIKFRKKKEVDQQFPYHLGRRIEPEGFNFRFFIQMTAQTENEINNPMPIITGVLSFPEENYYTFHVHNNDNGVNEVDIFPPHFIDQYAHRAPQNGNERESYNVPDSWPRKTSTQNEEEVYQDLFTLVGMFFGHNKMNYLCKNNSALSRKKQKEDKDGIVTLWMDGISYCDHYCYENTDIWLHKTFLPYFNDESTIDDDCIGEDQFKSIAPDLNTLFKDASVLFPYQYKSEPISSMEMFDLHKSRGISLKEVCIDDIQNYAWKFFDFFEKQGYITIKRDCKEPPRFTSEKQNKAKQILSEFCNNTICSVGKEVAQSLLQRWSWLYWELREFESWYTNSGCLEGRNETNELKQLRIKRGTYMVVGIKKEAAILSKVYTKMDKLLFNNY